MVKNGQNLAFIYDKGYKYCGNFFTSLVKKELI